MSDTSTVSPAKGRYGTAGTLLSSRQAEVLSLAAAGRRNPDIVRTLGISTNTVNTHFRIAEAKLRARNRTHSVAVAIRRGLI